jgi:hypothetical protein
MKQGDIVFKLIQLRTADDSASLVAANLRAKNEAEPIYCRNWYYPKEPIGHFIKAKGMKQEFALLEPRTFNDYMHGGTMPGAFLENSIALAIAEAMLPHCPVVVAGNCLLNETASTRYIKAERVVVIARSNPEMVYESLKTTGTKERGHTYNPSNWEVTERLTNLTKARHTLEAHGVKIERCELREVHTFFMKVLKHELP